MRANQEKLTCQCREAPLEMQKHVREHFVGSEAKEGGEDNLYSSSWQGNAYSFHQIEHNNTLQKPLYSFLRHLLFQLF